MKSRQYRSKVQKVLVAATCVASLSAVASCSADSQEAERVERPVVVEAGHLQPVETNLGWQVEVQSFRTGLADLELTTEGEQHGSSSTVSELLVPVAHAHPGHEAGGAVIGEMPGRFVVDWTEDGAAVGHASMIVGEYTGANFRFATAESGDGVDADDPLVGHSVHIAGVARRGGDEIAFEAAIDQDPDRRVIGAPFEATVTADAEATLRLRAHLADPTEGDTLFDDIDFDELAGADGGRVVLEPDTSAYNRLKRALQVHDHYSIVTSSET
ncbi:MAG: hypothetical protein ACLFVJ_04950 [Persicimonas sp.]